MSRLRYFSLVLWIGLMLALSPWDLALSRAITNSTCWFGRLVNDWAVVPGCLLVGIALLSLLSNREILPRDLSKLILFQCLVQGLIVTHSLKQFWGRVRPSDVSPDPIEHTPFYTPLGPGGGESFPSGHVAAAMILAPLPFYYWAIGRKKTALAISVPLLLYWLGVSYGRVSFGVHYPTDTLFSLGFGLLLANALCSNFSIETRQKAPDQSHTKANPIPE